MVDPSLILIVSLSFQGLPRMVILPFTSSFGLTVNESNSERSEASEMRLLPSANEISSGEILKSSEPELRTETVRMDLRAVMSMSLRSKLMGEREA